MKVIMITGLTDSKIEKKLAWLAQISSLENRLICPFFGYGHFFIGAGG